MQISKCTNNYKICIYKYNIVIHSYVFLFITLSLSVGNKILGRLVSGIGSK